MKKSIRILMACALSLSVIAGAGACSFETGRTSDSGSGTVSGSDNPGNASSSDRVSADENPDAEIKLTVGTLGDQYEQDVMQAWINAFQKQNTNVSITISRTISGMADIITLDSGGVLPDIIWTAGDQHSPYSGSGYFQDLSDESVFEGSSDFFSDFYESLIDSTHYSDSDEGIWFVPRDYNRLVVYYNVSAFEKANVAVPENGWTWEDFLDTCQALMDAGCKKAVEFNHWEPLYTTFLANYGATYFDGNGNIVLDSAGARQCYEDLQAFTDPDDGYAIRGTGTSFKAYDAEGSLGTCVPMIFDVRPQLSDYAATAFSGNWSVQAVSFPNFKQADGSDGYVGAGCSGYAITKACTDGTNREWAWKFLQFCMSEEGYDEVSYLGNIVPALKSMSDSGEWYDLTYYGQSIDGAAFVATDTNDIFLNYYNVLDTSKHDLVKEQALVFWSQMWASTSYSSALRDFTNRVQSIIDE